MSSRPPRVSSSLVRIRIFFARLRPIGGEHMQIGEEPKVDVAIREIAALLAVAYQRRARIRLVNAPPEPLPSTEGLAISGHRSVHELTLTRRREESPRS
jgi:hypothetical protein